jgi:uncharacterized protein
VLCDLYDLVDKTDTRRLHVGWREDPRPVEGALQGAYAHLSLAHLNQSRAAAGRVAWQRYRGWVCDACEELLKTGALTGHGERFVAGMLAAAQDGTREQ